MAFIKSKYPPKLYYPNSGAPFKLSRSKIDLFLDCKRCFYMDRRLGVGRPSGFPFNLNSAVDHLLKKEFDSYRARSEAHPLMLEFGVRAIPFSHVQLETWRENFTGIQFLHSQSGFIVFGAVDDLWQKEDGSLIVVDYKSTSKDGQVSLDADWQISYKRQVEVYQWLLRQNGFVVSDDAVFVYCNGLKDKDQFGARLDFTITLITYQGDCSWVDQVLMQIKHTLDGPLPELTPECEYCDYRSRAAMFEGDKSQTSTASLHVPEITQQFKPLRAKTKKPSDDEDKKQRALF